MAIKEPTPEKEFKAPYLKDYKEPTFELELIPGVNDLQLQAEISVSGSVSDTANLQAQIDSLDSRVTALENP